MTVRMFVLRGALAGAIGGLVAFVFARIFAEPLIEAAVGYQDARGEAEDALAVAAGRAPEVADPEVFTRGIQGNLGLGLGVILMGVAVGLLFSVAYALAHGRVAVRPRVLALIVAGAGFLTLYATPTVKYPANPPAVGRESTIAERGGLFLTMVLGSLIILAVAIVIAQRVRGRLGTWNAALVGGLTYVVLAGVLMAILPTLGEIATNVAQYGPAVTETPQPLRNPAGQIVFPGFDPDLLYDFRLYSVTAQVLMWGVLGLVFGALAERVVGTGDRPERSRPSEESATV